MLGEKKQAVLSESAVPSPGMILIEDEKTVAANEHSAKRIEYEVKVRGEVYTRMVLR